MATRRDPDIWKYYKRVDGKEAMAECKLCKQRLRSNRNYNLQCHLRRVHNKNDEIWKYFDNFIEEGVAVCKKCNHTLQNRTCNLRIHMRRSHNIEVKKVDMDNIEITSLPTQQSYDGERIVAALEQTECNLSFSSAQKSLRQYICVKLDKNIIIRSVLGLVVEDRMNLSTIGSKNMQSILQPLCTAISSDESKEFQLNGEKVERLLGLVANAMRNDFSNELHCRLLSLKIETDLNASLNTFCLSVMFINNSQIQKRVLGIIELDNGAQLSEDDVKNILHKFNIDSNQIISAYWDNTKESYFKSVSNSEYLDEIKKFEKCSDLQLGHIKIERFIGTIAHQCILDVLKNPTIFKKFIECRNLVKFLNDQTNLHGLFERNDLEIPQLDSPWKWGSTHQMIQNLYNARSILETIKCENFDNHEDRFNMNNNMLSFIDAFRRCLNIIQKSILKFYEEELHCGDFYVQWLKCRLITQKFLAVETKTDSFSYMILTELMKSIDKFSNEILNQDRFVACLYLDPRFQRILNSSQKSLAYKYLKKLWTTAGLYNFEIGTKCSENQEYITTDKPMDEDEDAFLDEYLSYDVQTNDTKAADVYSKIKDLKLPFQMAETNILLFWKAQKETEPEMHTLSSICFAIPATQNYCQNIYSDFYETQNEKSLSDFTKENLLFMRLNAEQLNKPVQCLDMTIDRNLYKNPSWESESEEVLIVDDDSNTGSTSTSHSTGDVLVPKTAIVHPMTSVKTEKEIFWHESKNKYNATVDDESNTPSTSTGHFTGDDPVPKTTIVHPTKSIKTENFSCESKNDDVIIIDDDSSTASSTAYSIGDVLFCKTSLVHPSTSIKSEIEIEDFSLESENVGTVNDDRNKSSTSTEYSTGDVLDPKTAIVHPITSIKTEIKIEDFSLESEIVGTANDDSNKASTSTEHNSGDVQVSKTAIVCPVTSIKTEKEDISLESENENVGTVNDEYFSGDVLDHKTAIVHPITSVKTEIDDNITDANDSLQNSPK